MQSFGLCSIQASKETKILLTCACILCRSFLPFYLVFLRSTAFIFFVSFSRNFNLAVNAIKHHQEMATSAWWSSFIWSLDLVHSSVFFFFLCFLSNMFIPLLKCVGVIPSDLCFVVLWGNWILFSLLLRNELRSICCRGVNIFLICNIFNLFSW